MTVNSINHFCRRVNWNTLVSSVELFCSHITFYFCLIVKGRSRCTNRLLGTVLLDHCNLPDRCALRLLLIRCKLDEWTTSFVNYSSRFECLLFPNATIYLVNKRYALWRNKYHQMSQGMTLSVNNRTKVPRSEMKYICILTVLKEA